VKKELDESKINDIYLNEIFSKKITYKYYINNFPFDKSETLESLNDSTSMRVMSLNDGIGEVISYETHEIYYNCKDDIIRDIDKSMGKVTQDIVYENIYDEKFNLIKKRINDYSIHGDRVDIYTYENIYDEKNRLIKVTEKCEERDLFGTTVFHYNGDKIITKESKHNYGFYSHKISNYYYNEEGILYEEEVLNGKYLSHYYNYILLEDGRMRKTLVSPAKGKYRWKLEYEDNYDKQSCEVYILEPIITTHMIKEIMEYIMLNYKDIINCVIIDILGKILMYRYDNPDIYKYYSDNYGICILENM
jgi:hypothetical protein